MSKNNLWHEGINSIQPLIDAMCHVVGPSESGGIKIHSKYKFDTYIETILGLFKFSQELDHDDALWVVRKAAIDTHSKISKPSEHDLAEALRAEQSRYLKQPKELMHLFTSIHFPIPFQPVSMKVNRVRITIGTTNGIKYDRAKIEKTINELFADPPNAGTPVILEYEARTPSEFAYQTLNVFAALRGALNFAMFNSWWRKYNAIRPSPYNYIFPGSVHTIHRPNGELRSRIFHYEAPYTRPHRHPDKPPFDEDLNLYFDECLADICESPNLDKLLDFFAAYSMALDDIDPAQTFRSLWTLLEKITGSEPGRNHTQADIIRRICAISTFPETTSIEMKHLCRKRNNIVHGSEKPTDWQNVVNQLKIRIDSVFEFFIADPAMRKRSLDDLFQLMDQSHSSSELSQSINEMELSLNRRREALQLRKELDEIEADTLSKTSQPESNFNTLTGSYDLSQGK